MKAKFPMVKVRVKCPQGHDHKYEILMDQMNIWLPEIVPQIFRCDKCGAPALQMSYPKSSDHYVKFYVLCPHHGDREKKIDGPIFPHIDGYHREQLSRQQPPSEQPRPEPPEKLQPTKEPPEKLQPSPEPPKKLQPTKEPPTKKTKIAKAKKVTKKKCPKCSGEPKWVKEYKKWYCHNCQKYI